MKKPTPREVLADAREEYNMAGWESDDALVLADNLIAALSKAGYCIVTSSEECTETAVGEVEQFLEPPQ